MVCKAVITDLVFKKYTLKSTTYKNITKLLGDTDLTRSIKIFKENLPFNKVLAVRAARRPRR